MLMPNCREDETYNQDFIDGLDKEFIRGLDWCAEMAVDTFFANDMGGLMDTNTYLGHILNEQVPDGLRVTYIQERTFENDAVPEERKVETYADLIRERVLEWIEQERNALIVSMIDTMDDSLYDAVRHKVLMDNEKQGIDKGYCDTRSFKYIQERSHEKL